MLLKPELGLFFWTTIIFLTFFFLLAKFAWRPILNALQKREENIANALKAAEDAKAEAQRLKQENEQLLQQARQERERILKEAQEAKKQILQQAKEEAQKEAQQIRQQALQEIEAQKNAAIAQLHNEAAQLALAIAEKLIQQRLQDDKEQQALAQRLLAQLKQNPN